MRDDFYIGYLSKAPKSYSGFTKRIIILLFIIIPALAISIVWYQRVFSTAIFEFGNHTKLTGKVSKDPVPMIKIADGKDNFGNKVYKTVLLVGYGKNGAKGILEEIEMGGVSFQNEIVTLSGTLLYGDGKTLLELAKGSSFVKAADDSDNITFSREVFGHTVLKGEIIDPKCYFGVMKPGEGKPHRSCAIRCISGGIPPVLAVKNEKGDSNYFLILRMEGGAINQLVLDYVAEPVELEGELEKLDDWMMIRINTKPIAISRIDKL